MSMLDAHRAAAAQSQAAAAEQSKRLQAVKHGGFRDYLRGIAQRVRDELAEFERDREKAQGDHGDSSGT